MEQEQGPNKAVIGIIVVVLLAVIAGGVFYLTSQNNDASNMGSDMSSETMPAKDDMMQSGDYKDGTYTATGTYQSPGGQEQIELTVTLEDGVINSTVAETKAASGTSRQYQKEFVNNYGVEIIGKNVDEVKLDRVAGSSLTSNGFNDALDEIKQEAAA